ncbi:hypothetical protein IE077_003280 [Cardiosporidium cionae]|uniref:Uncharacterized protein n=1 Tax=Cardiosporidium cionae TaxID=476202 RepID=A0ABQ7J8N6_9APIC|nr:hypothetical protein IE077_003280 [Cardiosporidium cionae]|eukprot:KAF8820335.1 hypothetical protein IE077_003280 [Cardiosporidium cionae]
MDIKIQCTWKRFLAKRCYSFELAVSYIQKSRILAAIAIQCCWKGYRIRSLLHQEFSSIVLKWPSEESNLIIKIIGDFMSPGTFSVIQANYCYIRRCYVVVIPFEPRRFFFRYNINGEWRIHQKLPLYQDNSGLEYNIVDCVETRLTSLYPLFPWPHSRRGIPSSKEKISIPKNSIEKFSPSSAKVDSFSLSNSSFHLSSVSQNAL